MAALAAALLLVTSTAAPLPHARPALGQRTFSSPALEQTLGELAAKPWRDPELRTLFMNCLPMTLDATVKHHTGGTREDTYLTVANVNNSGFVGMWLRDSAGQVAPYMPLVVRELDGPLGALVRGVINRHVESVLLDPYAMAFSLVAPDGEANRHADDNSTCLDPATGERASATNKMGVRERKWEMDSVLATLKLGRTYWAATNDTRIFDSRWARAVETILETLRAMQRPLTARNVTKAPYTFQRRTIEPKDTLAHGVGRPARYTGMVRTAFLPSDDAVLYAYHVPGNAMAVVELRATAQLLLALGGAARISLAHSAAALADEIDNGIKQHGIFTHPKLGVRVLAAQVDGFGNAEFADDANVPGLLSLPMVGYLRAEDPLYLATRRYVLSEETNPYFYGPGETGLAGVGSQDIGGNVGWGHVWCLGLIAQAWTSVDDEEAAKLLRDLARSSSNGFMHESVWMDDFSQISNPSFAWANSMLGELILHLNATRPHLLFKDTAAATTAPWIT